MPEIVEFCLLCGKDRFAIFDQRDFRGFEVINVLCSNCGLVFQTPRMPASELEDFYQQEYRIAYQGQEGPSDRDFRVQKARAGNLVKFLQEVGIDQVVRYVDIGSSAGLFMGDIQKAYDCQVVGIEPGDAYRETTISKGFDVYEDLDQLEDNEENKFDMVSMIHVLEHLPDPVGYLITLREKFLTLKGKLLLEVPNIYAHDSFEVAHLTSFSRETFTRVLDKAGYRTIFIEMHGIPLSKLIPLYITILAEPYEDTHGPKRIEVERLVRMKRRAGFLHRRVIERIFPKSAWVPEFRS